jgi:hypothetical protein
VAYEELAPGMAGTHWKFVNDTLEIVPIPCRLVVNSVEVTGGQPHYFWRLEIAAMSRSPIANI